MESGRFSWADKADSCSTLTNLNLTLEVGSLTAVVGEVGAGKSSLLSAILGEMTCQAGALRSHSRSLAYVSQTAWIQNMTVKGDISRLSSHWSSFYITAFSLVESFIHRDASSLMS